MTPFFSIIIPVYNVAPYLRECLDSVLAQTFTDWEAICVDDGSTDGSGAILDEYAAKDRRFRVIRQPNAGVSAARNVSLDMAKGEVVCFCDADDKLDAQWFETAAGFFKSVNPDVLRLRAKYWHIDGTIQKDEHYVADVSLNAQDEIVEWAWSNLLTRGWSWLFFVKRSVLDDVRFPLNLKIREDTIFVLRFMMRAKSFVQGGFDGYFYRWHSGSAYNGRRTIVESSKFPVEFLAVWNEACAIVPKLKNSVCRQEASNMVVSSFVEWLQRCDRNEWSDDRLFRDGLNVARDGGLLDWRSARGRWVLPLCVFLACGSLFAFYCTQRFCETASRVKRRMLRR